MSLPEDIKQKALELGFDLVGITDTSPIDTKQINLFADWLKADYAGQMNYLHRNLEKRINPAKLLENAQSVICVGLNYKPPPESQALRTQHNTSSPSFRTQRSGVEESLPKNHPSTLMGRIATYAQYEDYHVFIKNKLRTLTDFICSIAGRDHKFKICVDSAPLAERALAARAGLGFIGKNHLLINPTLGLQIFLGEIITDLKLEPDLPITNNCASCDKCVDACPTSALRPDDQLDANKCISYLTIEYKGRIPADLTEKIDACLFGCDECILTCPYQQNAPVCKNKQFKFYSNRTELNLQEILKMTESQFQAVFADSVIKRSGLDRLKRSAKICLANPKRKSHIT